MQPLVDMRWVRVHSGRPAAPLCPPDSRRTSTLTSAPSESSPEDASSSSDTLSFCAQHPCSRTGREGVREGQMTVERGVDTRPGSCINLQLSC